MVNRRPIWDRDVRVNTEIDLASSEIRLMRDFLDPRVRYSEENPPAYKCAKHMILTKVMMS